MFKYLMKISLIMGCLLSADLIPVYAQEDSLLVDENLIDVGRLNITHVTASSVNGNRPLDNEYYGVLNLFDNGKNEYGSWLTDAQQRHWIQFTFDQPVEIHSITIETSSEIIASSDGATEMANTKRPKEFALETYKITGSDKILLEQLDSIPIKGFLETYQLPEPVENVSELAVIFPGPNIIEISEIRIMGAIPENSAFISQMPSIGTSKSSEETIRATRIKIKNISPYHYELLLVGNQFFGNLGSGQETDYKIFAQAYRYNAVSLAINGQVLKLQPIDYVGEEPLGPGYFTYLIDVDSWEDKRLSIETIKDK